MIEARSSVLADVGVVHGFGGRRGGVSRGAYASANAGLGSGDDRVAVRENRRRFALALGAPAERLCTLRQVHGVEVQTLTTASQHERAGDAVVSATAGLVLAVTTADCVPVLLVDPEAGVAAAIHAGWRSAVGGVVPAAVAAMARLGAEPARCRAAIGPCIRQPSYEVDALVRDAALARNATATVLFSPRPPRDGQPRWAFDLAGLVRHDLDESGVTLVDDVAADTLDERSSYFSFRRSRQQGEATYGVQLSGIVVPASGIGRTR